MKTFRLAVSILALVTWVSGATQSSVSQYGITWTFDKAYEVGQFANGDWWVVGPVTISSVSPGWTGSTSGSMVNPPYDQQAFDSRSAFSKSPGPFVSSKRAVFPLVLQQNQSLVSTIGDPNPQPDGAPRFLKTAAVLTAVDGAKPAGTFRPPYAGTYKPYFNMSQLQRDLLPQVKATADMPVLSDVERCFQRVWLDNVDCNQGRFLHPIENMPDYGEYMNNQCALGALLLMTDSMSDKLLVNFIQVGLDFYGTYRAGARWPGNRNGHANGRKWPILFAGMMLDAAEIKNVGINGTSNDFIEDADTYYGQGGVALWGVDCIGLGLKDNFAAVCNGTYESGEKSCRDPNGLKHSCSGYRHCCTSYTWVGPALAALMMHAKTVWNHNAHFDYVDSWVAEEYFAKPRKDYGHLFIYSMWQAYRDNLPPAPSGSGTARFYAQQQSGPASLEVTFVNTSTSDLTTWAWNFGDGQTSTDKSPVHTYQNIGSYTVTLIGSGTSGSDTMVQTDYITVTDPALAPVVIEAEDMTLSNGYIIDTGAKLNGTAIVIDANLAVPTTGTAITTFTGTSGTYTITLSTIPENDGEPTVKLYVNGSLVINETLPLDPQNHNYTARKDYVVSNITVNNGDVIKIEGTSHTGTGFSGARVDKITFQPASAIFFNSLNAARIRGISVSPNPMRDMIRFETTGHKIDRLTIFDNTGNGVKGIIAPRQSLGTRGVLWDGTDIAGNPVNPGVYYYEILVNGHVQTGRIIKLK